MPDTVTVARRGATPRNMSRQSTTFRQKDEGERREEACGPTSGLPSPPGASGLATPGHGQKGTRRGSSQKEKKKKGEKKPVLPCCLVWDWDEEQREEEKDAEERGREGSRKVEGARCKDMQTPEELRDFIFSHARTPGDFQKDEAATAEEGIVGGWRLSSNTMVNGPALAGVTTARAETDDETSERKLAKRRTRNPLIILHGLPSTFVRIILDSDALDIDPDFIEAHAWKRGYRPTGRYQQRRSAPKSVQYACWNYPELARGFKKTLLKRAGVAGEEVISKPGRGRGRGRVIATLTDPSMPIDLNDNRETNIVRSVSDCDDLAAVFCRASLWKNGPVGVLFLDRPAWERSSLLPQDPAAGRDEDDYYPPIKKARRKGRGAVTEPYALKKRKCVSEGWDEREKTDCWDVCLAPGKEIPSFEEAIHDTLASWSMGEEDEDQEDGDTLLMDALEETTFQKWLDFFEVLTPRQHPLIFDGMSLEWRILQALEGNLLMAREQRRRCRRATHISTISVSDWEHLIQRLRRHVEILPTVPLNPNNRNPLLNSAETIMGRVPLLPPHREDENPSFPGNSGPAPPDDSDNQRALDRVTYLGGILLPISIVSGVLSMNEDFEPGAPFFWVFWVAALPLTGLTMVIIYADKLRRAQVWVQVEELQEGSYPILGNGDGSSLGGGSLDDRGKEDKLKLRMGKKKQRKQGQTRYDGGGGGYLTSLERLQPVQPPTTYNDNDNKMQDQQLHQEGPTTVPEAITYGGLVEADDIVIDLSGAIQQGQEPQTISVEPSPPPPASAPPPTEEEEEEDSNSESDHDDEGDHRPNIAQPPPRPPPQPVTWRRKELGWGGAAMCILKMQKPKRRVEDGLPSPSR